MSRVYRVVATIEFMHLNDMLGTVMVIVRSREIVSEGRAKKDFLLGCLWDIREKRGSRRNPILLALAAERHCLQPS